MADKGGSKLEGFQLFVGSGGGVGGSLWRVLARGRVGGGEFEVEREIKLVAYQQLSCQHHLGVAVASGCFISCSRTASDTTTPHHTTPHHATWHCTAET